VEDLEIKLARLLKPMYLPWNRKGEFNPAKLKWLKKNLGRRNDNHTNYTEAVSLIDSMIKLG